MNLSNIKNGIGYVTVDDIFDRLKFFSPPDEEYYFIKRISGRKYSIIGLSYYGGDKTLFRIFTGSKDLYALICKMSMEAATRMDRQIEIEEWADETN